MELHIGVLVIVKKKQRSAPYIVAAVALLIIIIGITFLFQGTKDHASFAACLAEKGFILAGTEWCSHCNEQKSRFEGAFEEVIIPAGGYKDCDRELLWCQEKGITGYPTWVAPDDNLIIGTQSLATLARISGCRL